MQNLTQQFADWVRQQDPEATFNPWCANDCAGHQFLRSLGYPVSKCWVASWEDTAGVGHPFPDAVFQAIDWACGQTTVYAPMVSFGELASRLSQPPEHG